MDTSLDRTIHLLGGQSALAAALNIAPQAVQQWKRIPPSRALQIEELTKGEVTALEILREAQVERVA